MAVRWLVMVSLVGLVGCRAGDQVNDLPGYQFTVPADVPARYVVVGKDGERTEVDGHALYAWGHRQGWADCWRRHRRGQIDPRDEAAEPVAMQEPDLAARARRDGFQACRRMLLAQPGAAG
jgi:hypothetical protein